MGYPLFILIAVLSSQIFALQKSNPFVVSILDRKVTVISPKQHSAQLHAILDNKTLSTIVGKMQTREGRVIDHLSLRPGERRSVAIGHLGGKDVLFYPLAPAGQMIELVIGRLYYEIPAGK